MADSEKIISAPPKKFVAKATAAAAATAVPTAAQDSPDMDLTNYIRDEAPYPLEQVKRIEFFYKKRERDRNRYRPTAQGDLAIYSKTGDLEESIRLLTYVPHDPAIREKMDQNRLDAIGYAETKYEEALLELRAVTTRFSLTGSTEGDRKSVV